MNSEKPKQYCNVNFKDDTVLFVWNLIGKIKIEMNEKYTHKKIRICTQTLRQQSIHTYPVLSQCTRCSSSGLVLFVCLRFNELHFWNRRSLNNFVRKPVSSLGIRVGEDALVRCWRAFSNRFWTRRLLPMVRRAMEEKSNGVPTLGYVHRVTLHQAQCVQSSLSKELHGKNFHKHCL